MSDVTKAMSFLDLCRNAAKNRWCTKRGCTTCGGLDFRGGLKAAGFDAPDQLALAIKAVDLDEMTKIPGWDSCVEHCLSLVGSDKQEEALKDWFGRLGKRVRIADVILFRFLRHLPGHAVLADRWSDYCIELAEMTADESLIETLLIVRPEKVKAKAELVHVANKVAGRSKEVAKLLKRLKG